jgi:hypothetical protein
MPDSPVLTLLNDLRVVLQRETLRPDKIEERFRLIRPFEKRLAELSEQPHLPPDDRDAKLVTLLWSKVHPERSDWDTILPRVSDDDALVRATAVAAIGSRLERKVATTAGDLDPSSLYRLRLALERQRVRERTPALAFQFEQLISEVKAVASAQTPAPPPKPANPYVAGPPLRDGATFFGRDDVLSAIVRAVTPGSAVRSLVIYGGRRSGKTSILYRIRDGRLGQDFIPVYFDMQSVAGTSLEHFITSLVKAVDKVPEGQPPMDAAAPAEPVHLSALRRSVRNAVARIGERSLVLMFDEFEVFQDFLHDDNVAKQLQSLLEQERRLFFIFAGAQKVESLKERSFQTLLDSGQYMKISFLSTADSRRLITEPARNLLSYPDEVIERIQRLTAGHPFYTQAVCQTLFDTMQASSRHDVTIDDVEQAVVQFVENPAPHLVLGWNALELREKIAASALASVQTAADDWASPAALLAHLKKERYPVRVSHSEMQEALSTLREQDWTAKREGEREFKLTMDLIRRWIVEHRSIWELLAEQRDALVERTAGVGKRSIAFAIDGLAMVIVGGVAGAFLGAWAFLAFVVAYFLVSMMGISATPGMLIMQVRALTETGAPLQFTSAARLGGVLMIPWLLFGTAFGPAMDIGWLGALLFLVSVGVVLLHAAMVRFGKKKRGLFDKLTHVIFVIQ